MRRKSGYIKCGWVEWEYALMSLPETNIIVDGKNIIHKWDHVDIYLAELTEFDEEIIKEFKKGRRGMTVHTEGDGVWELDGAIVSTHRGTFVTLEFRSAKKVK